MSELAAQIAERSEEVRERIRRAGADPELVRIVAVTKAFGPCEVAAAYEAGLRDFGENYADELVAKHSAAGKAAKWHFLGAVQRNKISRLVALVDCWQAVSRIVEGEAIERHLHEMPDSPGSLRRSPSLLVEVETTGMKGRGGSAAENVPALVKGLRALGCEVDGLMTVAPPGDAQAARRSFELVARLGRDLGLAELSMGMSEDLEQAVAAGATMVRLGTALFGPRPQRRRL